MDAHIATPTHDLIGANEINNPKFLTDKESIQNRGEHGDGDENWSSAAARWYCCLHSCHCVLLPVCRLSGHRE